MNKKIGAEWLASRTRRSVEVGATLVAIPVGGGLAAAAAMALYLEHGDTPLFVQKRVGSDPEVLLRVPKLKSLSGPIMNGLSPNGFNHENAGRIGSLVRKTHVDEAPQLVSVLTGSMSLIGPRPLTLEEFELTMQEFSSAEQKAYLDARKIAKPGIAWPGVEVQHRTGVDMPFYEKGLRVVEFVRTTSAQSDAAFLRCVAKSALASNEHLVTID